MHSYLIVRITHFLLSLNQMAESIVVALRNDSIPAWLPSPGNVVLECTTRGWGPSHLTLHQPAGSDAAIIKWGPSIAMSEARTQEFLAKQVNGDKNGIVRIPDVYLHSGTKISVTLLCNTSGIETATRTTSPESP